MQFPYLAAYHHFNSLPHAEVDKNGLQVYSDIFISTHYLTQRQTGKQDEDGMPIIISTHYLTQRQTMNRVKDGITEEFQLTTSRRGRPDQRGKTPQIKIFQLTTSRRGRQQFVTKSMDINHRFHNKSHNKSLFFALIILCLSIFH